MSNRDKSLELADERTAAKIYAERLAADAQAPIVYSGPRSGQWTGTGAAQRKPIPAGHLVGRVALKGPDHWVLDGSSDFYIGETHLDADGIEAYSWTAPIACTFFRGQDHHKLCDEVAVIRAFRIHRGKIVDFSDDVISDTGTDEPFRKRELVIPRRSHSARRPKPSRSTDRATSRDNHVSTPVRGTSDRKPGATPSRGSGCNARPTVRAESLLRAQLEAPRTRALSPVLSTLQPDQYELVSVPAMESMIIEGQPGAGKTIVASHRAAYMISDQTPEENTLDGKVLLVGPTVGYSNHVREVVDRLTGDSARVVVQSIPELMARIIKLKEMPSGHSERVWQDVDWKLGELSRVVIRGLKDPKGIMPSVETVYELLRMNGRVGGTGRAITHDPEWAQYLQTLPPFRKAVKSRVHTPLLAFIAWEVARPEELKSIEHIIVDEAQDLTALEWQLLLQINEADQWTILGDLNQRRSDHTPSTWNQILDLVAIDPETPVRHLERGYRSTRPILEFANRLLQRDQRALDAFQEHGPEPVVDKVGPNQIGTVAVRQAERMLDAYPNGTVAVISSNPAAVRAKLRSEGWSVPGRNAQQWRRGDREVTVLDADEARGLEFDGVVVVEPSDFRQNFGRRGPLYTALTRPNRELVVVHSKALPDRLRCR